MVITRISPDNFKVSMSLLRSAFTLHSALSLRYRMKSKIRFSYRRIHLDTLHPAPWHRCSTFVVLSLAHLSHGHRERTHCKLLTTGGIGACTCAKRRPRKNPRLTVKTINLTASVPQPRPAASTILGLTPLIVCAICVRRHLQAFSICVV